MVTEDEARNFLARAAATIDVRDAHPAGHDEPGRRPYRVTTSRVGVVAAVGVLVAGIAGAGFLVGQEVGVGEGARPADGSPGGTVVEQEHRYGAHEMPSLLGYTREEAVALLEGRGVAVRTRPDRDGCDVPGIVTGSSTPVGSRLTLGEVVTIRVVTPARVVDCVGEADWDLLWSLVRFARGLGGPPDLSDRVRVSVEQDGRTLVAADRSAEQLATPGGWAVCGGGACHSPLAGLAQMLTDPASWQGGSTPFVSVSQGPACLGAEGDEWQAESWSYQLWVAVPTDGVFCPTASLLLGTDDGTRIASVELRLPPTGEAETIDEEELEQSLNRAATAAGFVSWARGDGLPPTFADEVRFLVNGKEPPGAATWVDDPTSPGSWDACSGAAAGSCLVSPLEVLDRYPGPVAQSSTRSTCPDGGAVPEELVEAAGTDLVRLDEPEPATCAEAWAVELWIDEDGAIYAVNLAVAAR